MNFIVDAQLPPALARWIAAQGNSANHVFDLELNSAADLIIWNRARSDDLVIVSKDEDFVDQWLLSEKPASLFGFAKAIVRTAC